MALGLDAVSIGLYFTPWGIAAKAGVSLAISGAAMLNAATQRDLGSVGIGVVGYHIAAFDPAMRNMGRAGLATSLGGLVTGAGTVYDVSAAVSD